MVATPTTAGEGAPVAADVSPARAARATRHDRAAHRGGVRMVCAFVRVRVRGCVREFVSFVSACVCVGLEWKEWEIVFRVMQKKKNGDAH